MRVIAQNSKRYVLGKCPAGPFRNVQVTFRYGLLRVGQPRALHCRVTVQSLVLEYLVLFSFVVHIVLLTQRPALD